MAQQQQRLSPYSSLKMLAMEHLHLNNNFKQGMLYALVITLVFTVIVTIAYIVDMPK